MRTLDNEDIAKDLALRLVSERKRLGLEQDFVREALGIALSTMSRYENAKRYPDLVLAKRLSDLGYDMGYVISGKRIDESVSDLSDDEMMWLELYRNSRRRDELIRLVKAYESLE